MATITLRIEPGDIRTRAEIKPVFGGSPQGGICPAVAQKSVVLYSDEKAGAKFGYHDGWIVDDGDGEVEDRRVFEYTGAGTKGNQTFDGPFGQGNAAVLHHATKDRILRLFIAVDTVPGTETVRHRYVGAFKLDEQRPYEVRGGRDETGVNRLLIEPFRATVGDRR